MMMPRHTQPERAGNKATCRPNQGGFSLLEVLIAVVILSIGLLGLAGLQTTSLQSNFSAAQVSQATFLASDLMDRMRANSEAAENGDYNINFGTMDVPGTTVAADDMNGWLDQMQAALPGVTSGGCDGGACGAEITVNDSRRAEITIRWVDERFPEDDERHVSSFRTVSRL